MVLWCLGLARSLSLSSSHLAVISVGPVGGAAVARLVDLALLLQAAGLATLAGTALNTHTRKTTFTHWTHWVRVHVRACQ